MEYDADECERGAKDAAADIEAGHPKLYYGTRGRWGEFLTELMDKRFGVTVVHASDITNTAEMSYQRGYNDAVRSSIDQHFGEGIYQAAMEEVDQFRQRYYDEYFKQHD